MPRPQLRTRSKKPVKVTLPCGESRVHYRGKIPSKTLCSICNKPLGGITRLTTAEMCKLNRSKRRIWRPYGGQICPICLKKALKQAARAI